MKNLKKVNLLDTLVQILPVHSSNKELKLKFYLEIGIGVEDQ